MASGLHFGKYRGQVTNNLDPMGQARLQVSVAHFPGLKLGWALPCLPWAGNGVGFYAVPPVGANVWVEFEGGDLKHPIWTGCFWDGPQVVPGGLPPQKPLKKILKTQYLNVELDDTPSTGGITVTALPPAVRTPLNIKMDAAGILLDVNSIAKVALTPTKITIELPPATATFEPKKIAISLGEPSITIEPSAILTKHGPSTINVTPQTVDIKNGGASKVGVSASTVAVKSGASTINVNATAIEQASGPGKAQVGAQGASITHGGASVEAKVMQVAINKTALTVK
ncbi:MAG: phage baseplate assembly protein V [Polyangiaceae bacterium]